MQDWTLSPSPLDTHRPAGLVVVPVHGRARVRPVLPRVCEFPGHQHAEVGVLTAPPPFPAVPRGSLVVGVTATDGGGALGAGAGDSEGHPGRGDGVDEGGFSCGCGDTEPGGHWSVQHWCFPSQPPAAACRTYLQQQYIITPLGCDQPEACGKGSSKGEEFQDHQEPRKKALCPSAGVKL